MKMTTIIKGGIRKMKLLLYCVKSKPYLIGRKTAPYSYYLDRGGRGSIMDGRDFIHNGKIVAECDFEVEEIKRINTVGDWFCYENQEEIMGESKLDVNKFFDYLQGKNGYAIHIKNLNIFDKPQELSSFYQLDKKALKESEYEVIAITKAPQNMMYCEDGLETKIIISIRPKWLCEILNGKKTIEVRKKVLKGILKK